MDTLWTRTAELPRFAPLRGDLRTDVLIVGGGMAGLLCAYLLTGAGIDCALVEADRLCGGATKGTTAKLTVQHGLLYRRLLRQQGRERAKLYLQANQAALDRYRALCRGIDCDFSEQDAYVYTLDDPAALEQEVAALDALGCAAELVTDLPLPLTAAGAVRLTKQAQFHPLRFAAAIARGLPVYEHTKVLELGPGTAVTDGGRVRAERIVIAAHFPVLNKHGGYFLKLYQHRSYVLALRNAQDVHGMYVDGSGSGLSFRNAGDLLLLGGGGHRTGKGGGGWRELETFKARRYPRSEEVGRWAAQDCMSLDGVPYIGRYSRGTRGLYVATGFNKWGMTGSMAAAMVLTELLQGRESPCAQVFDPSRGVLRRQLAVNLWESLAGMARPTAPRCPHMGCALRYNPEERSWDCPCHGSRFAESGELLDNPATDDKKM